MEILLANENIAIYTSYVGERKIADNCTFETKVWFTCTVTG